MADKPFQRKGAKSNAHVGKDFERRAQEFFAGKSLRLVPDLSVSEWINRIKKPHRFDLGNKEKKIIVECKSHTWTEGGNVPSAKMISWNETMYLFVAAPASYRKILSFFGIIARREKKPWHNTISELILTSFPRALRYGNMTRRLIMPSGFGNSPD